MSLNRPLYLLKTGHDRAAKDNQKVVFLADCSRKGLLNQMGSAAMLCCMSLLALSCAKVTLTERELKAYVLNEENGLAKRSQNGDFTVEAYYRPQDLIITQQLYGETATANQWDSLRNAYSKYAYFVLHLSKNNREVESYFASNPAGYNEVVNYFNGSISSDISLLAEADTLAPLQTIYTPSLGSSNYTSVMAVFPGALQNWPDNVEIVWEDTRLKTGTHRFVFSKSNIVKTPALKPEI
jgi:hypothetical protein